MSVNLSALAGAGQQFFSDNGVILSGGKLYSYAAGTTTPQAAYTSASGSTPHTNPIILNSAGRVATGEIWLTAGENYKFSLFTSTDVLIATWDNITGINGTGITTNAVNVEYDPAGTGAVATNVQTKLRESVSVKDFGAVGDGVTDDTAALTAFFTEASGNICILPAGTYKATSLLSFALTNCSFYGVPGQTKITGDFGYTVMLWLALNNVHFYGITFENTYTNVTLNGLAAFYSIQTDVKNVSFSHCTFTVPNANVMALGFLTRITFADTTAASIDGLWVEDCTFTDCGEIGCTVMNRGGGADKYTNATRVYFNRNKGKNLGTALSYGMLLSLDGFGSGFTTDDNVTENSGLGCCIENTGWINGSIRNNLALSFAANGRLLSIDGTDAVNGNRAMTGLIVSNNRSLTIAPAHSQILDASDSVFSNNSYLVSEAGGNALLLRRAFNNKFINERYVNSSATGNYALFSDVTSSGNMWDGKCEFSTAASGTNNAVIAFWDACTNNIIESGATITKGTGGFLFQQAVSAALNYVEDYLVAYTPTISGSGTAGTPTYTVQAISYSLKGKVLSYSGRISITAIGGMAGDVRISLPIALASGSGGVTQQSAVGALRTFGITIGAANTYFISYATPGSQYFTVIQDGSAAGTGAVQCSQLAAASTIFFSGSYQIA